MSVDSVYRGSNHASSCSSRRIYIWLPGMLIDANCVSYIYIYIYICFFSCETSVWYHFKYSWCYPPYMPIYTLIKKRNSLKISKVLAPFRIFSNRFFQFLGFRKIFTLSLHGLFFIFQPKDQPFFKLSPQSKARRVFVLEVGV